MFYEPMAQFLPKNELNDIFPSFKDIYEYQTAFLNDLVEIQEKGGFMVHGLGNVFLKHVRQEN
jgi:hypothetical protein